LRRAALKRRPQRPADRPYLYNSWGLRCLDPSCSSRAGVSQLFGRADILWVSVDLNDHIYSNDSVPLPGVTIPPPKFYHGTPWAGRQGRYVITFTGACRKQSCSDRVRSKLRELSRMPATSPLMRIACTEDMRFSGAKQATIRSRRSSDLVRRCWQTATLHTTSSSKTRTSRWYLTDTHDTTTASARPLARAPCPLWLLMG